MLSGWPDSTVVTAVLLLVLKAAILAKLYVLRLFGDFRYFTAFVSLSLVSSAALWMVLLSAGERSPAYANAYLADELGTQLLSLLAVLELVRKTGPLGRASIATMAAGAFFGVLTAFYVSHRGPYVFPHTLGTGLQIGVWIVLLGRLRAAEFPVTKRIVGLLIGFFLMFGLQWLVLIEYANERVSYGFFSFLIPAVTAVAHLVFLAVL